MTESRKRFIILLADDDPEDRMLLRDVLMEGKLTDELRVVEDGECLLEYLQQRGKFVDPDSAPRPDLILLDLNMPKKDGYEVLKEIKTDPLLCDIPVVVLTQSSEERDIIQSYKMGANSYITKPITLDCLINTLKTLWQIWSPIGELPKQE